MASNLTTIETLDKDLMENQKYDMGFIRNFKQVFGENKLLWFLPIYLPSGYPNGDGLTWPTKEEIMPLETLNDENNVHNNVKTTKICFLGDNKKPNITYNCSNRAKIKPLSKNKKK